MWFEDQIKQREKNDEQAFSNVCGEIAGSVLGKHKVLSEDKGVITNSVIDEILKYYDIEFDSDDGNVKNSPFSILEEDSPKDPIEELEEKLKQRLEPHGILYRHAKLEKGWEKNAIHPMIGIYEENVIALIPNKIKGYSYKNLKTGEKIKVKGEIANKIERDVICFYEPLPVRKLGFWDLVKFSFKTTSVSDIAQVAFITLIISLINLITPIASNYLFSKIIQSKDVSALISIGITFVCLSLSTIMFSSINSFVNNKIGTKQSVAIDSAMMMRVLSMPAEFYRKFSSGELTKTVNYASALCQNMLTLLLDYSLTFVFSFAQIFVMAMYAPSLIWVVLLILVANVILAFVTFEFQKKQNKKLLVETAKEYGIGYSLIAGIQKIKLAGAEKRAFAKWGTHYAQKAEHTFNPPFILKISGIFSTVFSLAGMLAIYFISYKSQISVANYYSFLSSYGIFSSAVMIALGTGSIIASIKPTLEIIKPILDTVPENGGGKEIVEKLHGRIELDHVSFRYEEGYPNVINNLSLSIKAGEYVAIVGTTGCGKSTLLRLLLGLERPISGSILFDSYDINTVDIRSLRRKIGTVVQNGKLFTGSIYSNIVITAPNVGMEGAWEAARLADVADDIMAMPMGMQTLISEGSGGISGGQRQRILIARALASKPKILIFDEATSALDNVSQKKVSDSIDSLKCTRIVVAHRLSTIKNCDRILVLDQGQIVEEGNYDTLIEKNGLFAKLVERQRLDK